MPHAIVNEPNQNMADIIVVKKKLRFVFYKQLISIYVVAVGLPFYVIKDYFFGTGAPVSIYAVLFCGMGFTLAGLLQFFFYAPGNCMLIFSPDDITIRRFWRIKIVPLDKINGINPPYTITRNNPALMISYFTTLDLNRKLRRANIDDIYEMRLPDIADMIKLCRK